MSIASSAGLRVLVVAALLLGGLSCWKEDRVLAAMGLVSGVVLAGWTRPALLAYNRGRERWLQQDVAGAIAELSLALERDPSLTPAYLLRGRAYLALKQAPLALADFDRAIQLAPRQPQIYAERALIRLQQGDTAGAIADLNRLVALRPSAPHHLTLAHLHAEQGSPSLALQHLEAAIRLDPTLTPALVSRATLHSYQGNWEAALADWSAAIGLQPDPVFYFRRGMIYFCNQQLEKAIADWNCSLESNPEQPHVFYHRGNAFYALGDLKAALDDYDCAFHLEANGQSLAASDEYALYGRGLAHYHMGDWLTAASDWQAALAVCRQHHNEAFAQQIQRLLLQLNPSDPRSAFVDPDSEELP